MADKKYYSKKRSVINNPLSHIWNTLQGRTTDWQDISNSIQSFKNPFYTIPYMFKDTQSYTDESLNNDILGNLTPEAKNYWNSLLDSEKEAYINKHFTDEVKDFGNLWGLAGEASELDFDDLIDQLNSLENIAGDMPVEPDYDQIASGIENDPSVKKYLDELQKSEDLQKQVYQDQLRDNQAMFDDYRSQILGNQYQQQSQLMGTVGSEMSKARRNALEAGASAGLRMAENINTTLAMQNKQSQISLETSNQLAQQLLNQRQAAAGIRGDYNSMLANNSAERRQFKDAKTDAVYNRKYGEYQNNLTNWENKYSDSDNPFAEDYRENVRTKSQSQYGGGN